jgi:coproporphyrinogen III oxidase
MGAKKLQCKILAEGEATGHAHVLIKGTLFEKDGQLFFNSSKVTGVIHQEHAQIQLPAGAYKVIRQREYVPAAPPQQVRD